jgi:Putative beta-barrel porin 2
MRCDSFGWRFTVLLRAASTIIIAAAGLQAGTVHSEPPSPLAEETDLLYRPDVAGTRRRPGFETKGVPVRSVIAFPTLKISVDYDSNIFNRDSQAGLAKFFPGVLNAKLDRRGDAALRIEPGLKVSTNWSRHSLALNVSGRATRFAALSRENSGEFETGLQGRLDLGAEEAAFASIAFNP